MKKRLGRGLVAGGITGVVGFLLLAIFVIKNRLREKVVDAPFAPLGEDGKYLTITAGMENWQGVLLLVLGLMAASFFMMSIGFRLIGKESVSKN